MRENEDTISRYKSKPWFIGNNEKYIKTTSLLKEKRQKKFEELSKDTNYEDVAISKSYGLKAKHKGHSTHPRDENRFFKEQITGDEIEESFYELAFRSGKSVIFCDESKKINGEKTVALDMIYNGVRMDLKSVTEESKDYRNQFIAKNRQAKKWNKIYNDNVDSVCLYFHEPSLYEKDKVIEGYKRFVGFAKNKGKYIAIKNIICVIRRGDNLEEYQFSF